MKQEIMQKKTLKFYNVLNEEFKMQIGTKARNIIKFIIVCLIPFFSGFFTIWAFWNPVENLNKIPMAIVNNDRDVCIVYDYSSSYFFDKNAYTFYDLTDQAQCDAKAKEMWKDGKRYQAKFVPSITDKVFKSIANAKNKICFDIDQFSKNPLDIDYVKVGGTDYTPVKYWSKTIIPSDFSRHLRTLYDLLFQFLINSNRDYQAKILSFAENEINWFINNKVLFWGTFKENFIAGELIYVLSQLKTTLLSVISDKVLLSFLNEFLIQNQQTVNVEEMDKRILVMVTMINGLKIMSHNSMIKNFTSFLSEVFNEKNLVNWIETIFNNNDLYEKVSTKWVLKDNYNDLQLPQTDISNNINTKIQSIFNFLGKVNPFETKIQGAQFRQTGIGLGQFFICISLWIWAIAQTFIFTRKKHNNNYGFFKNYFSKMILMLTTSLIQTSMLLFALLIPVMGQGSGFASLGFKIYSLLYLSSLYVGFIFVLTVQEIWFAFKNYDFARLVCFGYLLMNLIAGGGIVVSFMQASFFKWISYVVPFSYSLQLFSSIIYGIEINQIVVFETSKEIVIKSLILLIWPLIFITFTFLVNYFYNLKSQFATYNIKLIFKIINDKNNNLSDISFTIFSWHKICQKVQNDIKQIVEQEK